MTHGKTIANPHHNCKMACKIFLLVLAFFYMSFRFSKAQVMVPAVFLFGDSLHDVGNNIHLGITIATL
ncbi:hypothetical protein JRO89_XS15G0161900 [Xanthoceras sorbifolium]|uniref:Uncharacterized protein n=1 Tax=Xanthoceras sorbifolium TaxID=99658 RepID=A0ABQ8H2G3_9ROSI|nr:hypothetical protein JRO89_XS15G0161900 [Xanthoceras sorbifolium]